MNQTTRPTDSQPTPHTALMRAGFHLITRPDGSAWERLNDDGTAVSINKHGEYRAPHRWSHRVDLHSYDPDTKRWRQVRANLDLAVILEVYGQPSPASPEVAP